MFPEASGTGYSFEPRLDGAEQRFLGDSSGVSFIRAAIELAREQGILKLTAADELSKVTNGLELGKLTCLSREMGSQTWPSPEEAKILFDIFDRSQFQSAIIGLEEFEEYQQSFLDPISPQNVRAGAALRMTFANALYIVGQTERSSITSKSAETYYEETVGLLSQILPIKDLVTLQIVLLILQFSLANPRKPVAWHLLGYALRLSASLGLHQSDGFDDDLLVPTEVNIRRRLFWTLYRIDRAVGNTLGRQVNLILLISRF